jgi:putative tryptophan/tyrosine transport system permease protein
MVNILLVALLQGFEYGLVTLGVMISFRIIRFPDLTIEGSFPLGGAITASMIAAGAPPGSGVAVSLVSGFAAGVLTGVLNTKFKISKLLSGLLVMTILFTVNLRIMGRSNIPLLYHETILTPIEKLIPRSSVPLILFFLIVILAGKWLLDRFLETELGLALRATGDNEQMIRSLGVDTDLTNILGLGLANAMIALSGSLVTQDQGFADISMGVGVMVTGLAAMIIGETLLRPRNTRRLSTAMVAGTVIYYFVISLGLRLGLAPTDLKLATGMMVAIALCTPALRDRFRVGRILNQAKKRALADGRSLGS